MSDFTDEDLGYWLEFNEPDPHHKLSRCPFCGETTVRLADGQAECNLCQARSPTCDSEERAYALFLEPTTLVDYLPAGLQCLWCCGPVRKLHLRHRGLVVLGCPDCKAHMPSLNGGEIGALCRDLMFLRAPGGTK